MIDLKDTIEGMTSPDYKERFIAEYQQLEIRYNKLVDLLQNWDNLDFTPTCPRELLSRQAHAMLEYIMCITERARIEGIELSEN